MRSELAKILANSKPSLTDKLKGIFAKADGATVTRTAMAKGDIAQHFEQSNNDMLNDMGMDEVKKQPAKSATHKHMA